MKRLYSIISFCCILLGLLSCNDDKEMIIVSGFHDGDTPALNASSTSVTLNSETPGVSALSLTWGEYSLSINNSGYDMPDEMIDKYIELSANSNFEECESSLCLTNSRTYTHIELNNLSNKMGMQPWETQDLYIRIKYVLGNNIEPQYSNVVTVGLTPYGIRLNTLDILSKDQESVTGYLYSPAENGIYTGFVGASGWMNAYFRENDGTMWGNDGIVGTEFKLSKDEATHWNIWYPGVAGSYLTTVDTHTEQWSATLLTNLTITVDGNPVEMKFSVPRNTWTGSFSVNGATTINGGKADTKAYTLETGTSDDAAIAGTLDLDFYASVPKAGNFIITLNMGEENIVATVEEGEIEESNYQFYLDMINPDNWDDVKCKLYSFEEDYIYKGFYFASAWENFKFATEDRETIYGSVPESLYELDPTGAAWNIWMDTEQSAFYMFTANLADNTWTPLEITSIAVSGDFNDWSITTDLMSYDAEGKIWTAILDINYIEWGMNIILNEDWDMKLTQKSNGVLQLGPGNNIVPAETGTYFFSINFWDMNNITYTLIKQ